jgi:hypothetical protein
MEWVFQGSFIVAAAAGAFGILLSLLVLKKQHSKEGLFLGLLVLAEGINFVADSASYLFLFSSPTLFAWLSGIGLVSSGALAVVYLVFLRVGLTTKSTKVLQSNWGTVIIVGYSVWALARGALYIVEGPAAIARLGPSWMQFVLPLIPFVWALIAAIQARKAAQTPEERRKANAFLAAFAVHDVAWVFLSLATSGALKLGFSVFSVVPWIYVGWAAVAIVFFPGVTYAAFTGLLTDVDRTFRIGLTNATAATVIGVLFVVGSAFVESLFAFESRWTGVAVAVILAFAFQPFQDFAEKGAFRLFPSAAASTMDYQSAVSQALADGSISYKEQRMLDDLRLRLAK